MRLSSAGLAERVGQDNQGDRHAHEYQHDLAHITQCLQVFRIHKFLPHHLKIKTYLCISLSSILLPAMTKIPHSAKCKYGSSCRVKG
jgi:hypothetical protein